MTVNRPFPAFRGGLGTHPPARGPSCARRLPAGGGVCAGPPSSGVVPVERSSGAVSTVIQYRYVSLGVRRRPGRVLARLSDPRPATSVRGETPMLRHVWLPALTLRCGQLSGWSPFRLKRETRSAGTNSRRQPGPQGRSADGDEMAVRRGDHARCVADRGPGRGPLGRAAARRQRDPLGATHSVGWPVTSAMRS